MINHKHKPKFLKQSNHMKLFILPPGRYKYKVHGGPFLGEHKSSLQGVSINEASIFEEDIKYVGGSVSRYGQFSHRNGPLNEFVRRSSLLDEFVVNKIDRIHAQLQSRVDNMCLTYNPGGNEFHKNICSDDVFQVFTEIPHEKYKEYEKISRLLTGKNKTLKRLQTSKESNNSKRKKQDEEKGKRRSEEIKQGVLANHLKSDFVKPLGPVPFNENISEYLRRRGFINSRTQPKLGADIFKDSYLNALIDFKTKGQVAEEIRKIEKISERERLLNNRSPVSLIGGFKEKQSELIPSTLRTLENYKNI